MFNVYEILYRWMSDKSQCIALNKTLSESGAVQIQGGSYAYIVQAQIQCIILKIVGWLHVPYNAIHIFNDIDAIILDNR